MNSTASLWTFSIPLIKRKATPYFIKISVKSDQNMIPELYLRKPDWTNDYMVTVNGSEASPEEKEGWIRIAGRMEKSTEILLQVYPHIIPVKLGEKDNRTAFRFGPILIE